ncbi:MAG: methionine aminopeptidase [Peptococcaceae bacterium BICA1-7]|nr:MAG: methionine aminopeptidase [Peptococcaceae bacterium BICA1-7]HBV96478.1 type I methionyl aminopeptidase [Desulfotomaculum sp.]
MTVGSERDMAALKRIGKIVAMARQKMLGAVRPGITTAELDFIGKKVLSGYGARPAPQSDYNFPGATCISVNDEAAHGIPGPRVLREGDTVNVDVSAELDGYYADTGATASVGRAGAASEKLRAAAESALYRAIEKAVAGVMINEIGRAIFNEACLNGFTVIKNLTGHGIGRRLHEEPHNILNYYDPRDVRVLGNGTVLAIETFISAGAESVYRDRDGWTLKTIDGCRVAQFEHTIVVTKGSPIILTI